MKDCGNSCPIVDNTLKVIAQQREISEDPMRINEHLNAYTYINRGNEFLATLAVGCETGRLRMRAVVGDTVYTATLCTSSAINEQTECNKDVFEPVFTNRSPIT